MVVGGQSLFALAHTKDLLAAVRATVNRLDELAWMRYLTLFEGVGEVTADRIIDRLLKSRDIKEARLVIQEALATRAAEVLAPIIAISRQREAPGEALKSALQSMGPVFEHIYREDWSKRRPDIELMISLAERRSDLVDFIETYTLDPIHGTEARGGGGHDSVTLITIHSAKGLEGKRVFIPQAQYGMYPFVRSMGSEAGIEEERRILYVALTRAQDELILSNGGTSYRGFQTSGGADFFLERVPEELLEHRGESAQVGHGPALLDSLADWG